MTRAAALVGAVACLLLAGGPLRGRAAGDPYRTSAASAGSPAFREPLAFEQRPPTAVFFGSSTTAGSGASRLERRWTQLVASALGWIEVNRGLSGSMLVHHAHEPIPSGEGRVDEVIREDPEIVIVMYGANDAAAGTTVGDERTPGTFHHAAAAVLDRLRDALPDALLVVCTPQPAAALVAGRAPYDAVLEREARRVGALFVPAHRAFPSERLPELASDSIHLNDGGHAALAEFVSDEVRLALDPAAVVP